tara:strand:+ start:5186 stop:6808 length:1623 start_codon:yes stop_codon:yes gene_type:complete
MAEDQTAYSYQAPDQYIYNLLTGGGNRFGLLPGVEQYYASQFQNLGAADSSPFTYTGERIADFSPREKLAMGMADTGIGAFQPYFNRAAGLSEEALATLAGGTSEAKAQLLRSLQQGEDYTRTGLDRAVGAEGEFRGQLSEAERLAREGQALSDPYLKEAIGEARRSVSDQQGYLQDAQEYTRASTAGFDPSSISQYMDPYEDQVVQQAMKDIRESQAKSDIGRRAGEVGQGAFGGARSRLTQEESDRVTGRGLMDAVSGIRSQGFQSSRDAAMGEFGRQRGAEAAAAGTTAALGSQAGGARSGLAGLLSSIGGQRGAGMERLASNVAGFGQQGYGAGMGTSGALTSGGQQLYGMGTGASSALSGLAGQLAGGQQTGAGAMQGYAAQLPGLMQGDVSNMMNIGAMNRARNQAQMDLNYQNFVGQYNLPQQLMSGYANFLTGAGPLAGGTGYSGTTPQNPYGTTAGTAGAFNPYATMGGYFGGGGSVEKGGKPIPEGNKGLASLANKAPDVVRKMGFNPARAMHGGIASRFPMTSRKMRTG